MNARVVLIERRQIDVAASVQAEWRMANEHLIRGQMSMPGADPLEK